MKSIKPSEKKSVITIDLHFMVLRLLSLLLLLLVLAPQDTAADELAGPGKGPCPVRILLTQGAAPERREGAGYMPPYSTMERGP